MLALGQLEFTGHEDAASEIDEAAAAFGLQIVEPAREVPEWHLWPDLVPALHLWNGALTQWRTGYSGPVGLDYAGVRASPAYRSLPAPVRQQAFEDVVVMERETLAVWREQDAKRSRRG